MTPRALSLRFDPPYDEILSGILAFGTLAQTEETIRKLEDLRQRFLKSSDKRGVECCRRVGMEGRRRAEMIAGNPKVSPSRRLQKREAAFWFQIWLETPDLFGDWLELRKNSAEYRRLEADL
jgi:hypothetical protein